MLSSRAEDGLSSPEWGQPTVSDEPSNFGFVERATKLFCDKNVNGECDLSVKREDHWYVLKGKVDSHDTKRKLFSLVPELDGARYIVDRIRVGAEPRRAL